MQSVPNSSRRPVAAAASLLVLMAVLMLLSAWDDSATTDDVVSIGAGYSYLRKQEYRFEPQNPPLIKDFAALPLLWMNLHEPWDHKSWAGTVDEQDPDVFGRQLLYHSGNDADAITRAARMPMILFALAFGSVLFWWTQQQFGDGVALLTLFLYAFSPTFLAHGRMMATDLGATAGFFIALTSFLRFLKHPSAGNVLLAGLAMGFAFLTKFSTIALLPITLILAAVWALVQETEIGWFRNSLLYMTRTAGVIAIAYLVIYPVYLFHIWNFEPAQQVASAIFHRNLYGMQGTAKDIVIWASDKSVLRPWAEYFLGLLVALKASRWGQPLFFLGTVYPSGLRVYFPFVYLIKEPLALHLLTLLALPFAFSRFRLAVLQPARLRELVAGHFTEFAFLFVLGVYWTALIRSNMNIGVRHLLPAFPFTFILVSGQIVTLSQRLGRPAAIRAFRIGLGALLAWQAITVFRVHPSYLAYFNELAGGPDGGWRYVNDSNLDWGQDVKRLAQYVKVQGIAGIHADYFGPADAVYYLKDKYLGSVGCSEPPKGWVAVSAMVYPGAPWNPTCDYRQRLPMEKLVTKIGYSIFVFHVE
ncbi:MAG: glycosyltransferase family 39 protein [Acidobacteria bacterium]|nr:glycosyltransferase family 39 protein [Acidobacteriota bacterium]